MKTPKIKFVLSRDRQFVGRLTGGSRRCQMEGCQGEAVAVRWSDGKLTWPCSKGLSWDNENQAHIL